MKLVKMSLAAAMLMGVSAYAVENVKISGDAQVFYSTQDADYLGYDSLTDEDASLFDKDSSAADAALHLKVSADLVDGISAGASYTAISTLGLENNFVSNVWAGSHTAVEQADANFAKGLGGLKVDSASWFNEAWVAATLGKTTAKIGRMEVDTPLAFTETWTIERNTFEAAVAINQDLPDTTIVAAYIGTGNGTEFLGENIGTGTGLAVGGIVNADGEFTTYGTDGAYAAGIINNSFKPLTVQAWYYDVTRVAQAYWLQADLNMEGILAGAQYANVDLGDLTDGAVDASGVYALMLGYEMKDVATLKVAYSSVDDEAPSGFNTATSLMTAQSKLYTEAWWNYGYVTAMNASALNVTLTATVAGFDLGAYYTAVTDAKRWILAEDDTEYDMNEFALTVGRSFGPLDATLAYINTDAEDNNLDSNNEGKAFNMVQAYLTLNF
jgi:hypothetical protein